MGTWLGKIHRSWELSERTTGSVLRPLVCRPGAIRQRWLGGGFIVSAQLENHLVINALSLSCDWAAVAHTVETL